MGRGTQPSFPISAAPVPRSIYQCRLLFEQLLYTGEIAVRVADEPRYAMVRGLEQMFDEPLSFRRVMRCGPSQLMDLDRDLILRPQT